MLSFSRRLAIAGTVASAAAVAALVAISVGAAGPQWSPFTNVDNANKKGAGAQYGAPVSATAPNGPATPVAPPPPAGYSSPNVFSPELVASTVTQGSTLLENPSDGVAAYGYLANGTFLPVAGAYAAGPPATVGFPAAPVEATKTEPDKNTFLYLTDPQRGADPNYDYGRSFLYQGHENGTPGYITRINLDANAQHRVTLLATREVGAGSTPNTGKQLPNFDGSTWDPWAQRLLFTAELGANGGVWQSTLSVPSSVVNLQPYLGRGGFESIQNDQFGNIYYVEDVGGANISVGGKSTAARRPNSFIYRFIPVNSGDLTKGGKIQALQVLKADGTPITYEDGATVDSPAYIGLHTYGQTFKTKWLTIATTPNEATYGATGPDLNALAKTGKATPFKRPENGVFRPETGFNEFFFTETGDTNATSPANGVSGGWGGVQKLVQNPSTDVGTITVFYNGDQVHTAFDNIAFLTKDTILTVEDAGDTLHTQRNALDSGYVLSLKQNFADPSNSPTRFIAQGRDASATLDSGLSAAFSAAGASFPNDGDNEITGITVSNGSPSTNDVLGAVEPNPFTVGWRVFVTMQHGDNVTYELLRR